MNRCILVAGYPAAGKSTFAQALSQTLNIPCFRKDRLNEIGGQGRAFRDSQDRRQLSTSAFWLLYYLCEEMLAAGGPLILESNFKPHEAPPLKALFARYRCVPLTFLLTGDMNVLYARYQVREHGLDRHPIHKIYRFDTVEDFAKSVAPLGHFDAGGQILRVDTTDYGQMDTQGLVQMAKAYIQGY